ncbi:hypothetical protein [Rhizobium laguerreae]|uniref:hypothetical protein n=1 Tax=Rhizobium laguerreae TaxID=1076926 RepID=UPI001C929071|nr:hypothetical protein [Rhizobium laguerreae]MBY3355148.1 hypothetical protein [Rhizobium laguerreae]MBY3454265.1 hypothetical protein [Rhizobium laguerreae]MBY3461420.1 hypothetical protein [Rhizobium laguerreae]
MFSRKVGLLALAFTFSQTASSYSKELPSTSEFMNAFSVCALSLKMKLNGKLEGSIESLYEGARTEGQVSSEMTSDFVHLFAEQDRVKAYQLYTRCVDKIIGNNDGLAPAPVEPVKVSVSLYPPSEPSGAPGPIAIRFSGPYIFNVDHETWHYYRLYYDCGGRNAAEHFLTRLYGPYRAYSDASRQLTLFENHIWDDFPNWTKRIAQKLRLACPFSIMQSTLIRVDFDTEAVEHQKRFFLVNVEYKDEKFSGSVRQVGSDLSFVNGLAKRKADALYGNLGLKEKYLNADLELLKDRRLFDR